MALEDTGRPSYGHSCKGPDMSIEIMDFNIDEQNKLDKSVKLENPWHPGSTWRTRLQPEKSADYACRWIMWSMTFFSVTALEMKTSGDPTFRPAFVSLYGDDQVEDILGMSDFEQAKSDLPAFVLIPTIHSDEPFSRIFDKNLQPAKSLLQYHYRLGALDNTFERFDPYFAPIHDDMRAPCVREMWCLVLDNMFDGVFDTWEKVFSFSPDRYNGELLPNLSALGEHMKEWVEVEGITWGQAEPPEGVAHSLRRLWSIAIRFTMNFYLSPDRQIYQLDRPSIWRRITNFIHRDVTATSATTELLYRPDGKSKKRETLQSLEDELAIGIENLKGHDVALGHYTHLSKEWLARDSASQSQVYQISAISDELQILKEILHSQMQVVSQVSQSLAQAMVRSMSVKAVKGKAPETEEAHETFGTRKNDSRLDLQTELFNSLQRKSHLRHRKLAHDIERLQDAAERLKSQAALFIKIKAEDQSVAIYVFTLVTVVFLPLSFATSYMGMNTSDIRDMKQGQWIFWVVGGTLTIVVLAGVWASAYRGPRWKKARQTQKLLHMD
ncbi:Mg2+ transporter like zinc transport [Fusarium napiforme]|uniref:Mg2+ transporter like zinc transport n=1 Tax=Fusarium napiforme TaxID=42672 RepID=A0A8H5JV41_9HYPO|nr:Mg2+ transporter like zinc transport [Fusarium napiforme]